MERTVGVVTVPEGVEGNRYELLACLSWAEEFGSNWDSGFGPENEDTRRPSSCSLIDGVAACVRHLVASFDNFVKSHRRAHSLPGPHLAQVTDIYGFRDDTVQIGDENGLQSHFQREVG
ncbi:hypothetical protein N7537_010236 [Penicillium hordei]|uniref:Uncharacterized protein n=1 Tax=Penicillium hordei TaxID=40994 RepID=A0AAD6DUG1_9EURO|nr:uncharacterized protein N7537_010236 [Penicillium hordei]KAJ5593332.1 hypothetical protein N7537_010236 [Penicillium hordei]